MRQSSNETPPPAASGAVAARRPETEAQRVQALHELGILDSLPEQSYQDIVKLASVICDVPIALISLVDTDRQWFKARVGLDATETPRELAFCAHAILEPDHIFQVRDATRDARFSGNPLVTGAPDIRFYAGVPLVTDDGMALGTLCVIDRRPRELSEEQAEAMRALARQVIELLNLRRALGELRQTRSGLAQSEDRFHLLAQSVPEVIWTCGPDGKFDFISDRVRSQHGLDPANLIGHSWRSGAHPEDLERVYAIWERCLASGEPFEVQTRLRAADGSFRWYQCRAIALKDADGRPLKWFGSNTDIEDTLRSKEHAEAAARARSVFLSTMSHEIRTPMNAVLGFAGLLNDTPLTVSQRDFVQAIRTSGDHLLGVINDILDYSKIESGGLRLELAPFDVRRLVETALDLVSHQAQAKEIELVFTVGDGVPDTCRGDAARVRQVLVNLLGNAVKFTHAGEVTVHLEALPMDDGRTEFRFDVRDTGIGISLEAQARLFVEFSQAEADTARRFGGTGLGLAISKRIVEAHEGRIEVQSEPGRGSLFRVCIPGRAGTLPAMPAPEILQGRRVLIVDDNVALLGSLEQLARAWGLAPLIERDPHAALARVEGGESFDLALIDQRMPVMDGAELSRRLRGLRDLPIVLMAALGAERPRGIAFAAVLSKPVRQSRLQGALVQALQPRVVAPPPASGSAPVVVAPLSILLAEDNLTNQKLAGLLLKKLGYPSVDVAEDGEKALAAVAVKPYDVVLMDLEMPGIDGIEATRRIRAELPAERQPLIIAMTANVLAEDRERCREAGMDDYVSKPIDLEQLGTALRHAASRRRRA